MKLSFVILILSYCNNVNHGNYSYGIIKLLIVFSKQGEDNFSGAIICCISQPESRTSFFLLTDMIIYMSVCKYKVTNTLVKLKPKVVIFLLINNDQVKSLR